MRRGSGRDVEGNSDTAPLATHPNGAVATARCDSLRVVRDEHGVHEGAVAAKLLQRLAAAQPVQSAMVRVEGGMCYLGAVSVAAASAGSQCTHRTEWSKEPVTTWDPSLVNATQLMPAVCALPSRRRQRPVLSRHTWRGRCFVTSARIPAPLPLPTTHLQAPVLAPAGQQLAVRRARERVHCRVMQHHLVLRTQGGGGAHGGERRQRVEAQEMRESQAWGMRRTLSW